MPLNGWHSSPRDYLRSLVSGLTWTAGLDQQRSKSVIGHLLEYSQRRVREVNCDSVIRNLPDEVVLTRFLGFWPNTIYECPSVSTDDDMGSTDVDLLSEEVPVAFHIAPQVFMVRNRGAAALLQIDNCSLHQVSTRRVEFVLAGWELGEPIAREPFDEVIPIGHLPECKPQPSIAHPRAQVFTYVPIDRRSWGIICLLQEE